MPLVLLALKAITMAIERADPLRARKIAMVLGVRGFGQTIALIGDRHDDRDDPQRLSMVIAGTIGLSFQSTNLTH